MDYEILKDIAIILVVAKIFGIIARKLKAPQVVGEIIAGLLVGPSILGWVQQSDFLSLMAEIGVVLLMFSAGLETNLRQLLKTGVKALAIATVGVFIPMALGTLYYMCFYGFAAVGTTEFFKAVFIGTIMTATSVSITVETLREMKVLKGEVGTTILSAAIIDDVIGIIVLTFVIGTQDANTKPLTVVIKTVLFFVFAIVVGFITYHIFKFIDKKYQHTRRIPIFSLAFALAMAFVSEKFFGVADITGSYVAGIILCSIKDHDYIAEKVDINSYMMFGPLFFASIGIKTNISSAGWEILLFSIGFVLVALLGKIIGCGLCAKVCGFKTNESLKIGVGMMTRGEVALIVAQKGLSAGILDSVYFTSVILLILCSSIMTPLLLKVLYTKFPESAAELALENGSADGGAGAAAPEIAADAVTANAVETVSVSAAAAPAAENAEGTGGTESSAKKD